MDPPSVCTVIIQAAEREANVVEVRQTKTANLIKVFNPSKKVLYVARLDRIPRPPARSRAIDSLWEAVMMESLGDHTQNINNNIEYGCQSRKISTRASVLEPELILTGQGSASSSCHVSLSPNIWFRCGSSWVERLAKMEVKDLTWPRTYGLGDKIRVGLRAAVPASNPEFPVPPGLSSSTRGFALAKGLTMFLHVERPATASRHLRPSGCGLVCSITIKRGDVIVYNGCSRIGGILSIKEASGAVRLVGVTSGHALLDEFLTTNLEGSDSDSRPHRRTGRVRSLFHPRERHDATTSPSRSSKAPSTHVTSINAPSMVSSLSRASSTTPPRASIGVEQIPQGDWDPVQNIYSLNWLGGGWETVTAFRPPFPPSRSEMLAPSSDFALLELATDFANTFSMGTGPAKCVDGLLLEGDIHKGDLHVILGPGEVVSGALLSERPSLFLRGRLFPTRKIQLEQPLNLGVSGCWVVQGDRLCDMIALIYEDEPFAYMITAEKLISDIEKTLGDKVEVSLPSHVASDPLAATDSPQHPDIPDAPATTDSFQRPDIDRITNQLTRALISSPMDETKYFLPRDELHEILDLARVQSCLQHLLPKTKDVEQLATYASSNGNKIFAILVLINKPECIVDFYRSRVFNHDLPLERSNENGADFRLVRESDLGDSQHGANIANTGGPFDDWRLSEIRQFDDYQWYMLAPCIESADDGTALHLIPFHRRTILPFTTYDASLGKDGVSGVYRARIHPAHQKLRELTDTDVAVVKFVDGSQIQPYHEPDDTYRVFPGSPPVKALAKFTFKCDCYLIFPWGRGGSLVDLWVANPMLPAITAQIKRWMLEECRGLARGIAMIHENKRSATRSEAPKGPTPIPQAPAVEQQFAELRGLRGDLKPENIFCFGFRRKEALGGRDVTEFDLRILDMEATALKWPNQNWAAVASSPYSAPEFEMGSSTSQAADIWALGCIYLEFITWLLFGYEAVGEFTEARMRGGGDDKFFVLPSGYGGKISAGVKPAVREWVKRLRSSPACTLALQEFLLLVEERVLDTRPGLRYSAYEVANGLVRILRLPISTQAIEDWTDWTPPSTLPTHY
ncbi:hypothetical protein MAPG_03592 [Magnaporthiopsis poae ATCC 64411]|uniref:Protein kinase domain-containing protein n=1 Tax=Magnaporthiopsis poae (strain ATCC 64411 / 73-15) TaxID=644358 RepID=A0A0C4DUF2_MAGP6|nr:hypothetical protein MAPG_03592 [Magnaporthiopsis poae ATCC 64411]